MGLLAKAARSALGGGIPGAIAMVLQVLLLMWLRTTVNYQMVKGMGTLAAMRHLYAEGGVPRFCEPAPALSRVAAASSSRARVTAIALASWRSRRRHPALRADQGLWAALLQGPLSRFGDTAANAGVLALLEKSSMPVAAKTMIASFAAGSW